MSADNKLAITNATASNTIQKSLITLKTHVLYEDDNLILIPWT